MHNITDTYLQQDQWYISARIHIFGFQLLIYALLEVLYWWVVKVAVVGNSWETVWAGMVLERLWEEGDDVLDKVSLEGGVFWPVMLGLYLEVDLLAELAPHHHRLLGWRYGSFPRSVGKESRLN